MRKMSLVTTEEQATFAEVEKGKNPVLCDGRERVFKKSSSAPGRPAMKHTGRREKESKARRFLSGLEEIRIDRS
jgi:hypothetical protein